MWIIEGIRRSRCRNSNPSSFGMNVEQDEIGRQLAGLQARQDLVWRVRDVDDTDLRVSAEGAHNQSGVSGIVLHEEDVELPMWLTPKGRRLFEGRHDGLVQTSHTQKPR
ncbi:MAG: hypothetical protein JO303_07005 [Caulobacteraceae bacterium]|nr:hypothetical protein [Caulobacteraceae bacterium]